MNNLENIFEAFNAELKNEGVSLSIICVGGYVLEHHGLKATQDVDAFYNTSDKINDAIRRIGERFGINTQEELWLNNSVANMNGQPPLDLCEKLYSFSNLTVYIVPLEYILGMKMRSLRNQDLKDIGSIISYRRFTSPFEILHMLQDMGFTDIDFSVVLEGFSNAYGIDWLEEFFIEHQDELKKYY